MRKRKPLSRQARRVAPALLAAAVLWPAAAAADEPNLHPNLARGRDGVNDVGFEAVDFDRVNAFNGNLTVELPLGVVYPAGGELTYGFVLRYNAWAWDLARDGAGALRADPASASNAGLGWDLSFGRLLAPGTAGGGDGWVFVAPDGGAHPFYSTLHPGLAESDPGDVSRYTRDGTYLRLRSMADGSRRVESPDGTVWCFDPAAGGWRLTRIEDRFGNFVAVSYPADGSRVVTDGQGRQHLVRFRDDPAGAYPGLVERLELAAFGGTTAVYSFEYSTADLRPTCLDTSAETPATVSVPLLSRVVLPDGSDYRPQHDLSTSCSKNGRLVELGLPGGGALRWQYGGYGFARTANPGLLPGHLLSLTGVSQRTTVDAAGAVVGTWGFGRWLVDVDPNQGSAAGHAVTRVTDPNGHQDQRYFSVFAQAAPQGSWSAAEYGLPFTRKGPDGAGRYLERRVRTCGSGCATLREFFGRWEQDGGCSPADASCAAVNRRQASTRERYQDDPQPGGGLHHIDVDRSSFDGLGHYRTEVISGSFGGAARSETTDYSAAAGDYPGASWTMPGPTAPWVLGIYRQRRIDVGGESLIRDFCFDAASGRLTRRRDREATARGADDVVVTFTAGTGGAVSDERFYGADVQSLSTAADLCTLPLPAEPVRHLRRTHRYGALESERWVDPATGVAFAYAEVDRTIDRNTGLASVERDVSGLATTLAYDALGRPTLRQPPAGEGARLDVSHVPASGTAGPRATSTWSDQTSGTVLHRAEVRRDAFGRLAEERRQMPGGWWSVRETEYSPAGHRSRVAVPHRASAAAAWVEVLDPDPFGRPARLRRADGTEVALVYRGTRQVVRAWTEAIYEKGEYYPPQTRVATAAHTETTSFDRRGRRTQVTHAFTDPRNQSRSDVFVHAYDAADHPVSSYRDGMGIGHRLHYDGRGFLVRQEPLEDELEEVVWSQHDPLGLAGRRVEGGFDLTRVHDAAGRLVEVHATGSPTRVYKRFTYADGNLAGRGRTRGRMVESERHHYRDEYADRWFFSGDVVITVRQDYAGRSGRLSQRITTVSDQQTTRYGLTQSWSWSDLGEPTSVTYPRWTVTYPGVVQPPNRTVTYTYAEGLPTSAGGTYDGPLSPWGEPGWVDSVQYHAGGAPELIVHANDVHDRWTFDPAARVATAELTHTYNNVSWYSGVHEYDGGGTLYRIGDRYMVPVFNPQGIAPPSGPAADPLCDGHLDPFGFALTLGDSSCGGDWILLYDAADRAVLEYALDAGSGRWRGYLTGFDHRDRALRTMEVTWSGYSQPASLLTVEDYAYLGDRRVGRSAYTIAYSVALIRHLHANGAPESNELGKMMYDVGSVPSASLASGSQPPIDQLLAGGTSPAILTPLSAATTELPGLPITSCLLRAADQVGCGFVGNFAVPPSQRPECDQRRDCFQTCADCCNALSGFDAGSLLQAELDGICTAVLAGGALTNPSVRAWLKTWLGKRLGRAGLRALLGLCRKFREGQFEEIRNCNQECSARILDESCAPEEEGGDDEEEEEEDEEEPQRPTGPERRPTGPRNQDVPPDLISSGGGLVPLVCICVREQETAELPVCVKWVCS